MDRVNIYRRVECVRGGLWSEFAMKTKDMVFRQNIKISNFPLYSVS